MATSLVSTGVQFPDTTIQTTAATSGGNYVLNRYTSPATWTKTAGLKAVKVTVVGAGGNGGAGTIPGLVGQGGGGGGAAIYYAPAASIPGPQPITAGPGTNSFGAIASATAGAVGGSTNSGSVRGAAGGSGSGGTVNIVGGAGDTVNNSMGGAGGSSIFGGGGAGGTQVAPLAPGGPGGNYGGGGGGGCNNNTAPGGTGAPGIVIIEEFY